MKSEKLTIHIGTGGDRKSYLFDYGKVGMQEAIAVEEKTGLGLLPLIRKLPELSPTAVTAVVWLLRRRDEPDLQFEDVDFKVEDIDLEESADPKDDSAETPEPS